MEVNSLYTVKRRFIFLKRVSVPLLNISVCFWLYMPINGDNNVM